MSLRDFVLLTAIVGFSTSLSINRSPRLLIIHLSPEPMRSLGNISDTWKRVHPELKAPQLDTNLMKSYVSPDEKWTFSNEYKYSGEDYDAAVKVTLHEKKVSQVENDDMDTREKEKENNNGVQDIVMPDEFIPEIGSRNIIKAPEFCPEGQRKDSKGRCKIIIN